MATKTVLKNLLSKYAPISVIRAVETEDISDELPKIGKEIAVVIEAEAEEVGDTAPAPESTESTPPPEPPLAPDDYPFKE